MFMKKKVLLICPHSAIEVFKESKISVVVPHIPYISLASLAAVLLKDGHRVKILDLSISSDPYTDLKKTLEIFQPDFAGITFTIGLYQEAIEIAKRIKDYNENIKTIAGGAHPSIFSKEIASERFFDLVVYGEGENTLSEIVAGNDSASIKGLAYKKEDNSVVVNEQRKLIKDLNWLPYPAYYLYDSKKYHSPRVTSMKNPVAAIETSRGCPYNCIFCSKHIFQRGIRFKTPPRVVDEMEFLLNIGYKEIHVWDDCFSADLKHAKSVCDEVIRRSLKVCWNVYNGIRVDRVDEELLVKLKEAGCYRVSFGIESGDQGVLDRSKKGITIDQIKTAFKLAQKTGMETLGFFMIGLPGETKETIQKTINLAKELDIDLPKVSIATPLPGTEFFDEWKEKGLLNSFVWSDYVFHTNKRVAQYPGITNEEMTKYYNLFYRKLYLRPSFIWKRFLKGIKTGGIFFDVYYFLKVFLKFRW